MEGVFECICLFFTCLFFLYAYQKYLFPRKEVSDPGGPRIRRTITNGKWKKKNRQKEINWHFESNTDWTCNSIPLSGSCNGRQIWIHSLQNDKEEINMHEFSFDSSDNVNSSDCIIRTQFQQNQHDEIIPPKIKTTLSYTSQECKASHAAYRGLSFYSTLQCDDGHWPGDYAGPHFLLPGLVIVCYVTNTDMGNGVKNGMKTYLQNHQQCDGGWGTHLESSSTLFGTVLSYVALRLLGTDSTEVCMKNALSFITSQGGVHKSPSWAKFWLACAGLYDWVGIHSIPVELFLLPEWTPFHPSTLWCHARMVYLPMSFLYGTKYTPKITPILKAIRCELYMDVKYDNVNWNDARTTDVSEGDVYDKITKSMRVLQFILALYEKYLTSWGLVAYLRKRALAFALAYIHAEDEQTNFICIGPVNKALNMLCIHAIAPDSIQFKKHVARLVDYLWVAEDGVKMQGYNGSQNWDTAFAVQAMCDSGLGWKFPNTMSKAHAFLERNQIRENVKEHERWYRHISKGGWPFSTAAHGWPISDCTAESLTAVLRLQNEFQSVLLKNSVFLSKERLVDAVVLLLSLQNKDGGWATYEKNRGYGWYEWFNPSEVFGDIMIDYSYVECSAAVLNALRTFTTFYPKYCPIEIQKAMKKGSDFIRRLQRIDGSWYGSWAVCFTYGTLFGIQGLMAAGAVPTDPCIQKAVSFLVQHQRKDGGWSECYKSSVDKVYTEHERGSQIVQTAWALLALLHADYDDHNRVVEKGIHYLTRMQMKNGDWPTQSISGIFNRNCGITYTSYRNVFPIWALGMYAKKKREAK